MTNFLKVSIFESESLRFFALRPYYGLMSLMSCSFKFFEELLNTPHFIRNVEMSVKGPFQQHLKDLCGTLQLCYVVFFSWGKNRCKPNSGFGIGAQVCVGLATCCVFLFPLMMSSTPSLSPRVLSSRHAQLLVLGGAAPRLVSFCTQFWLELRHCVMQIPNPWLVIHAIELICSSPSRWILMVFH